MRVKGQLDGWMNDFLFQGGSPMDKYLELGGDPVLWGDLTNGWGCRA